MAAITRRQCAGAEEDETSTWTRLREAAGTPWIRILAVLWFAQIGSELGFSFALPFQPLYIQELGVTDVGEAAIWAGLITGVFSVAMAIMGPVWGAVADRFGHKLMIQRALFGASLVTSAAAFVQTPEQLLALRVLHGLLTGVVTAIATLVTLTTPRQYLASALGLLQSAMFVGISLGPALGGAFADSYGLRSGFIVSGCVLFSIGLMVTFFVPSLPTTRQTGASQKAMPGARLLSREVIIVLLLMAIVRFANAAPQPILPFFVKDLLTTDESVATMVGIILAGSGLVASGAAILCGRVVARFGLRATLIGCMAFAMVISPFHSLVSTVWQLLVLRLFASVAIGAAQPALQTLLTELTPSGRRGAAFGLLTTTNALGGGGGPLMASFVAAGFGIPAVFTAIAPVFGLGAWSVWSLKAPTVAPARQAADVEPRPTR
ncbi:MAG: MFS transporter [Chloroflexota bacterium]